MEPLGPGSLDALGILSDGTGTSMMASPEQLAAALAALHAAAGVAPPEGSGGKPQEYEYDLVTIPLEVFHDAAAGLKRKQLVQQEGQLHHQPQATQFASANDWLTSGASVGPLSGLDTLQQLDNMHPGAMAQLYAPAAVLPQQAAALAETAGHAWMQQHQQHALAANGMAGLLGQDPQPVPQQQPYLHQQHTLPQPQQQPQQQQKKRKKRRRHSEDDGIMPPEALALPFDVLAIVAQGKWSKELEEVLEAKQIVLPWPVLKHLRKRPGRPSNVYLRQLELSMRQAGVPAEEEPEEEEEEEEDLDAAAAAAVAAAAAAAEPPEAALFQQQGLLPKEQHAFASAVAAADVAAAAKAAMGGGVVMDAAAGLVAPMTDGHVYMGTLADAEHAALAAVTT